MKKIITICMMLVMVVAGTVSAEAKTTKKSGSKSSKTIRVDKDEDGLPIILGHTYRGSSQGVRYDFKFGWGYVDIIGSKGGYMESFGYPYETDGKTVYVFQHGVSEPIFIGTITPDGQTIKLNSGYNLRIVN